jgi:hypothetical protein
VDEQRAANLVARLDLALRRFPADACCADCGQRHPLLLCRHGKQVVCHHCRLVQRGLPPIEIHHVGGKPGTVTVEVPINLHVLLTWLQQLWRGWVQPGSNAAFLIDLVLLRVLGPLFGADL